MRAKNGAYINLLRNIINEWNIVKDARAFRQYFFYIARVP